MIILINLWPRDLKNQLKRMNQKLDEENGKSMGIGNGRYKNIFGFLVINFGRTLVVSFQILPLVFGGRGYGKGKSK